MPLAIELVAAGPQTDLGGQGRHDLVNWGRHDDYQIELERPADELRVKSEAGAGDGAGEREVTG